MDITQPDSKFHGANMGPTGPRWAPCWPHELCYLGRHGLWNAYLRIAKRNSKHYLGPADQHRISFWYFLREPKRAGHHHLAIHVGISSGSWEFIMISQDYITAIRPTILASTCLPLCQWGIQYMGKCFIWILNTLRPRQDGSNFPDDILKCISLNENV